MIRARKCRVGLRDPKRKPMLFEIPVTLVDGVTRFFFNGIALCGRRLPSVSIVIRLRRKQTDLYLVYFNRSTAAAKT